jgi:hypothetical protein
MLFGIDFTDKNFFKKLKFSKKNLDILKKT